MRASRERKRACARFCMRTGPTGNSLTGTVAMSARHSVLDRPSPKSSSAGHFERVGGLMRSLRRWLITSKIASSIEPTLKPKLNT